MPLRLLRSRLWLYCLSVVICLGLGIVCFAVFVRLPARTGHPVAKLPLPEVDLPLPKSEREYLWELEHHGQLLSQRGFKALSKALREGTPEALNRLLADDFEGSTLQQPRQIRLAAGSVGAVREEDQGHAPQPLNRAAFVAYLLQYRRQFGTPPNVQVSMMTLSPRTRGALDDTWEGTAVLRFWGETTPGAPAEITLNLRYRLNRPSKELFEGTHWLKGCAVTQTLVAKAPQFLMREVAAERGLNPKRAHDNWTSRKKMRETGGVYLCDYDRDGILDMLVTDLNGSYLYKGLPGGQFKDVTREVGLPTKLAFTVAFADLDGDGWDDLILGQQMYQNQPDGKGGRRFVDVTESSNLMLEQQGKFRQVVVADYDRDGRLDLYFTTSGKPGGKIGSWIDGTIGDDSTNRLYRNLGNWQFEDVTINSGAGGGNRSTFTAAWLDANNDGWPDLYVINEFGAGALLLNQGNGTFREQLLAVGPADFGSMGVAAGDIDNDGNIDLYTANMYSKAGTRVLGNLRPDAYPPDLMETMRHFVKGSQLWRNKGNLQFEPKAKDWQIHSPGWAYGPALVDLDNDGFLDLYATAGFMSMNRAEPDG